MDPNAARQSPQQRKFQGNRSKIMMLFRDQKAIVKHNDKHLNHTISAKKTSIVIF
jgi:hypothetical protein